MEAHICAAPVFGTDLAGFELKYTNDSAVEQLPVQRWHLKIALQ